MNIVFGVAALIGLVGLCLLLIGLCASIAEDAD